MAAYLQKIDIPALKKFADECVENDGYSFKVGCEKTDYWQHEQGVAQYAVIQDNNVAGICVLKQCSEGIYILEAGKRKESNCKFIPLLFKVIHDKFSCPLYFQAASPKLEDYYVKIGSRRVEEKEAKRLTDLFDHIVTLVF